MSRIDGPGGSVTPLPARDAPFAPREVRDRIPEAAQFERLVPAPPLHPWPLHLALESGQSSPVDRLLDAAILPLLSYSPEASAARLATLLIDPGGDAPAEGLDAVGDYLRLSEYLRLLRVSEQDLTL